MDVEQKGHSAAGSVPGLALVWAQSADRYIGRDGGLPWHLPEDLAHFRALTSGQAVVMGRTTWESLPERDRPLPGRRNIVLSRRADLELVGAQVAHSVDEVLTLAGGQDLWVIGGAQVYAAFLPLSDRIELTQVDLAVDGDTRAPALDRSWQVVARVPERGWATSVAGPRHRFLTFRRSPSDGGTGAHGRLSQR